MNQPITDPRRLLQAPDMSRYVFYQRRPQPVARIFVVPPVPMIPPELLEAQRRMLDDFMRDVFGDDYEG